MNIQERQDIERKIVERVIDDALALGFLLSVDDGEGMPIRLSRDRAAILAAMFSVDEEKLILCTDDGVLAKQHGWVFFVYGNDGWDVIADNHTGIEYVLEGATAYALTFQE